MFRCALLLSTGLLSGVLSPAAQPQAPSAQGAGELKITGCLAKGADGAYLLTKSHIAGLKDLLSKDARNPSGSTPIGTTGTVGAKGATPAPTATEPAGSGTVKPANTWWLNGDRDLDTYVGRQIEVTGRPASKPHVTSSSGTISSASPADPTTPERPSAMPSLDVSSVRTILSTCS